MSFFAADNIRSVTGGRWLQEPSQATALEGVGIDSRESLRNKVFIAIKGDRFDGHDFAKPAVAAGAGMLLVDRALPPDQIPDGLGVLLVDHTRQALADLALAYRRTLPDTCVIAVAGSAGKTTTKRLIDAALAGSMPGSASPKSFNNDIGVPLTILAAAPSDKYLIVEVGTNHLGEIARLGAVVEPDIVVITMIGREHLEGLVSLENIAQENAALLDHVGLAIVNADSPLLRPYVKNISSVVLFGEAADADLRLTARGQDEHGWWLEVNGQTRFRVSLPGRHNAINGLAAVAATRHLGVDDEQISEGLARARPAPMRMVIQRIGPITIYNDAYNANPDSMLAALETFAELEPCARRRIVILGDMLELGEAGPGLHRELARALVELDRRAPIDQAVFVGELSMFTAAEAARAWPADRVTAFPQMDPQACTEIAALIQPGDAVLIKGSRGMAMERVIEAINRRVNDGALSRKRPGAPSKLENRTSKIPT